MRILCDKGELQKCVNDVVKAVPVKSPVYLLEGIKIQAQEGVVTLYGSDGTMSIKCTMEANIIEPGEVVLTARIFSELLAKFDACEIALYTEGNNVGDGMRIVPDDALLHQRGTIPGIPGVR